MKNLVAEHKLSLYKTLTKLSENEKSEVFLVQHIQTNSIYVKKILANYNIDVYKAIQTIKSMYTPHIYEILEFDNELILIEEFVNGLTLEEILNTSKCLTEVETINYMIHLCDILGELHNIDPPIIHRDIKPSNIIINNDGILKLIDYDVSRTYKTEESCDTVIMGTQEYASPEQFGFSQTDCRSDIYSMGVLMNVLTTGNYPKYHKNDGTLKDIIKKCTKILPEHRYQSIKLLEMDLQLKLEQIKKKSRDNINLICDLEEKKVTFKDQFTDITLKNFYKIIPGFRSGKKWKGIIACFWYLVLIISMIVPNGNSFLDDLIIFSLCLILTILYTNFLNIRNYIPLLKKEQIHFRILGYIVCTFLLIIIAGAFMEIAKQ
ncbi:serine/threonine-protein kinase [Clostridium sp. MB40-C1]|uniref:serine/threonine-protein kinase n=1 Tax=Clostridium sp. MB40-C1 TaxID=3070996 RepID=UPI0027DF4019|nr:serine/threonine-protein kinase [Clostridium sp. MB40-C1]WMJ81759.1 serine/threonine-protein kinase [Clostridium sp. MB40-C1]